MFYCWDIKKKQAFLLPKQAIQTVALKFIMINRNDLMIKKAGVSSVQFILEMKNNYRKTSGEEFSPFAAQRDGLGRLIKKKKKIGTPLNDGNKITSQQKIEPALLHHSNPQLSPILTSKIDGIDDKILSFFEFHRPKEPKNMVGSRYRVQVMSLPTVSEDQETVRMSNLLESQPKIRERYASTDLTKEPDIFSSRMRSKTTNILLPRVNPAKTNNEKNIPKSLRLQNSGVENSRTKPSNIIVKRLSEPHSWKNELMPLMKGKPEKKGVPFMHTARKWPKLNNDIEENNRFFMKKMMEIKKMAFQVKLEIENQ